MNPRLHYLEIFSVLYMTQPLGRRAHRCLGMRTPTTHLPVPFLPTTHSTFLRHLLSHFKSVSGVSSVLPCFRWTPVPDLPVVLSLHISLLSSASEPHIMGVIDNQSVFVVVMHSLGTVPCFKFHRLGPVRCTRCATAHPPTKKTCANCMPWRNSAVRCTLCQFRGAKTPRRIPIKLAHGKYSFSIAFPPLCLCQITTWPVIRIL
jgi:hypothetical protein